MKKTVFTMALLCSTIICTPTMASLAIDFEEYTPTLDRLNASDPANYPNGSGYGISFEAVDKSIYDAAAENGRFVYDDKYYVYSYEPKFLKTTYVPTLDKDSSYPLSSLISDFVLEPVPTPDHSVEDRNYDLAIPTMTNGVLETKYYKISYEEKASEIGNKADERLTNSADISDTYENKHYAGLDGGGIYLGGGIWNNGKIDVFGDFIENYANDGGAIYNIKEMGSIYGDFIGNTTLEGYGGAIHNRGNIGDVEGNFIGNISGHSGGAIYNVKEMGSIYGDFIGNTTLKGYGGAVVNGGTIDSLYGNFVNNSGVCGGAISTSAGSIIESIYGDFVGNTSSSYGGAIHNISEIGNIYGDFVGNTSSSYGGAISNTFSGSIVATYGNFIGNIASGDGGAIYNYGGIIYRTVNLDYIKGDFVRNIAGGNGGAIYNHYGIIGGIEGDFINNTSSSENSSGGAIYNYNGNIGDIVGSFYGNITSISGGAIYNHNGNIGDIVGSFHGNITSINGGAIYNVGKIGNIKGDFVGNVAGNGGGAIYNYGEIGDIYGGFIENVSSNFGGAISNARIIGDIEGDFVRNSVSASESNIGIGEAEIAYGGGAIWNRGVLAILMEAL